VTGRTHVFSGPSLPATDVPAVLPGAISHPPVRHGDLLSAPIGAGDRVVVLDGVFLQSASVRHKEICELLAAGVEVWGAASMGALRAAELGPQGMRGAGTVYRLFDAGLLERDDEVALVHTEPDDGCRALTVALVSVRMLVRRMRRNRLLTATEEATLVAAAECTSFSDRSWRHVLDTADGLSDRARRAVEAAVTRPAATWDVKVRDAVRLLRRLARCPGPSPGAAEPPTPRTNHVERWRRRVRPCDDRLVTAAALYTVDYPALYRRVVLALIAQRGDISGEITDDDLEAHALAAVRRRGLLALHRDERELLAELVRGFRWSGGLVPTPALSAAISATSGGGTVAALVDGAGRLNDRLAGRGHHAEHSSRAALVRHLHRRWNVTELDTELATRGFRDLTELHDRAAWFTPQLVLTSPDPVRLHRPDDSSTLTADRPG